jgi:hypothetical protein
MKNKELYISNNVCITKGSVFSNGRMLSQYSESDDFSAFGKYLYKKLNIAYPKYYKMDNLCKLVFLAGEFLVKEAEIDLKNIPVEKISLIFSNSGSTIDTDTNFIETIENIPSPAIFVYTLPNISIGELCIRHGWKGEDLFLIQNDLNPTEIIDQVQFFFLTNNTKLCLAGWTEYISSENYKACLWLISDKPEKNSRILTPIELMNDFNNL